MKQQNIIMHINSFTADKNKLEQETNMISIARLILFLQILFASFIAYQNKHYIAYLYIGLTNILFIISVQIHQRKKKDMMILDHKIKVQEFYLSHFDETWKQIDEDGSEYLEDNMYIAKDLDLLGSASLFQYLNVGKTIFGKEKLAKRLVDFDISHIADMQEAQEEMLTREDFALHFHESLFRFESTKMNRSSFENLLKDVKEPSKEIPMILRVASFLLPIFTLIYIFVKGMFDLPNAPLMIAIVIQLICFFYVNKQYGRLFNIYLDVKKVMTLYEDVFKMIEQTSFESKLLHKIELDFAQSYKASKAMNKLDQILSYIQVHNTPLFHIPLNAVFMWDTHCFQALRNWKKHYGVMLETWIDHVATLEVIISLSLVGRIHETSCLATISKEEVMVESVDLRHPLLPLASAIANDVYHNTSTIITGSNMSGKTTYLRTIGINQILFLMGARVVATSYHATPMKVFTSMRIHDNVSEGVSTFYAELSRIKEVIEYAKEKQPMLVFIDEIFKGTNSKDRILGAKEVIRKLHEPWIVSFVSTHDLELCQLEEEFNVKNYHFEEYYVDDEIKFDYQLKDGMSTTSNAQALMRLVGIL